VKRIDGYQPKKAAQWPLRADEPHADDGASPCTDGRIEEAENKQAGEDPGQNLLPTMVS
jgi:hypothetical protein